MGDTVQTRVLVISDTHTAPLTDTGGKIPVAPFLRPLPKADLLLHCGDLTLKGGIDEYHATLDMLKEIEAPVKLVIAGNHDLSLDRDYMLAHAGSNYALTEKEAREKVDAAARLWTDPNERAVKEGVSYLTEGTHQIDLLNGAHITLYANPYTPGFQDWGFPYERNEDRFNPPLSGLSDASNIAAYPIPSYSAALRPVDIIMTHGPPYGRMDETRSEDNAGCPHLLRAIMRSRPLLHCFGHIHEGWGAERVAWSSDADQVTAASCDTAEWTWDAWAKGVAQHGEQITTIAPDLTLAKDQHGVFVDASSSGQKLERGRETLLVNAAIMDVHYKPVNAPWVVDLDLPTQPW